MARPLRIEYLADQPDTRKATFERAVALATNNGARLTVMDVTTEAEESSEIEKRFGIDLNAALRERRLEQLEALTAPYSTAGVMVYTSGYIARRLCRMPVLGHKSHENNYDLRLPPYSAAISTHSLQPKTHPSWVYDDAVRWRADCIDET